MKVTSNRIRSTMFWGLAGGLAYLPLCRLLGLIVFWPLNFQLSVATLLAGYGVMLGYWARKPSGSIHLPLLSLFLAAFFIRSTPAFLWTCLMLLGWIRSAIFFKETSLAKRLAVETGLALATGLPATMVEPEMTPVWAMGVWLFFLIQALYFIAFEDQRCQKTEVELDPFEKAKMAAENILAGKI